MYVRASCQPVGDGNGMMRVAGSDNVYGIKLFMHMKLVPSIMIAVHRKYYISMKIVGKDKKGKARQDSSEAFKIVVVI